MSELEQVNARLTRMENALDKLSGTLIQLARIEENMSNSARTHSVIFSRLDEHAMRVHNLEIGAAKNLWVERLIWLLVAAGISFVARFL